MLLQTILTGLVVGCLYALAGLGLVVIFRTTEVVNFAHGDVVTLVMFVAVSLFAATGLGLEVQYPLVLAAVVVLSALLSVAIERIFLRRAYKRDVLDVVVITLGVGMILNGIAAGIWGYNTRNIPLPVEGVAAVVAGVQLNWPDLLTIAVAAAFLAGTFLLLQKTRFGLAMRAAYQNQSTARLMGVNTDLVFPLTWALAGVLAAVAGLLIVPFVYLDIASIRMFMIRAFAAVVLGGFTSPVGAVVGGIFLGVVSNLVGVYVSADLKASTVFLLMLLILFIRPEGLLGARVVKKV